MPDETDTKGKRSDESHVFPLMLTTLKENAVAVIEYLHADESEKPERGRQILDSIRVITRETIMVVSAIWLLRWAWVYNNGKHHQHTLDIVTTTPFWFLVPGAIGLLYHLLQLGPRYRGRKTTVEAYEQFTRRHDAWWRKQKAEERKQEQEKERKKKIEEVKQTTPSSSVSASQTTVTHNSEKRAPDGSTPAVNGDGASNSLPNPLSELLHDNLKTYAPSLGAAVWSALALTLVFSIPAVISSKNYPGGFPKVHQPTPALPAEPTKPESPKPAGPEQKPKSPENRTPEKVNEPTAGNPTPAKNIPAKKTTSPRGMP